MVKLKEFFLLGPAEAGEDERLLKDLLVSSSSDKEGDESLARGYLPALMAPVGVKLLLEGFVGPLLLPIAPTPIAVACCGSL
jgi:hypothetical protein